MNAKATDWSAPADLRAQVQRLWDRGDLLRAGVAGTSGWPLALRLKTPSATDVADRFEAVREWASALSATPHVRLDWRDWNHRVQGTQRLPAAVWLETLPDALTWLGKTRPAKRFDELWHQTAAAQPALLAWLQKRPLQALENAEAWDRLLAVVAWLQSHPRPGVYLRQVDAPGVDSKFIEAHRSVLAELLDLALPPAAVDTHANGVAQFTRRFGFREKPARIRFRLLDPTLPSLPGVVSPDIMLDADNFATLALPVTRVFITENETNFLAFPNVRNALVVFGAGYGWEPLARAAWLQQCRLHYWGDLDTHGFAILDALRSHFPNAASFLMDQDTLLAHRAHWGQEPEPVRHDLGRLSLEETAVYDALRFDHLQPRLRLEQERVAYPWVCQRVAAAQAHSE